MMTRDGTDQSAAVVGDDVVKVATARPATAGPGFVRVVAVLTLMLLIAVVGSGGPRASSAQAATGDAGYTLMRARLSDGTSVVARWNPCQRAITYRVNLAGLTKARRPAMLRQIKAGFARLAAADRLTYRYTGSTTFVPRKGNLGSAPAEIVVAAVPRSATDLDLADGSLGHGGVLWSTWSGGTSAAGAAVVRGYVVLSPARLAGLKAGFGRGRTQGNVILHELGHATGLGHSSARSSLMNPVLTTATPDGFSRGDRAGLKRLGRAAGCIAVPAVVPFADLD